MDSNVTAVLQVVIALLTIADIAFALFLAIRLRRAGMPLLLCGAGCIGASIAVCALANNVSGILSATIFVGVTMLSMFIALTKKREG